jgi:hypothetical protein
MTPNDENPAPAARRGAVSEALPVPGVTHVSLPAVTADEAFCALRDACTAAVTGRAQIKLFLDGMLVSNGRHPMLPREHEDRDSYFARVCDGPAFAIYCGSIQVHSPLLFDRSRALLARLLGPDWVADGWVDAELFFGHYAYTPGGIHQETRFNLHWVLDGEKTMLVWPEEAWDGSDLPGLERGDDVPRAERAVVLPGRPGDVIHWPPRHWHVGRSPGLSTGVNVAVYPGEPFDLLLKALDGEMHRRWGDDGTPESPRPAVRAVPAALRRQFDVLLDTAASPELARATSIEWLRFCSAYGFRFVPPRRTATQLAMNGPLRRASAVRLFWITAGSDVVYAGNGHIGRIEARDVVADLLSAIATTGSFTPQDLLARGRGSLDRGEVCALVEDLYSMRVIEAIPAVSS